MRQCLGMLLVLASVQAYAEKSDAKLESCIEHQTPASYEVLISKAEIAKKVAEVAQAVDRDLQGEPITLVAIMKGALCIAADLMREIHSPCVLECVRASSYGANGTQRGELVVEGLDKLKVEGKNVLIVDDIFDSGYTLSTIADQISALKPKSVRSLIFLSKKIERPVSYRPTYVLFEVEDLFVFGYGMDYKEHLRGIPDVCCVR